MTDVELMQDRLENTAINLEFFNRGSDGRLVARASWTKLNGVQLHESEAVDMLHDPVEAALGAMASLTDEINEQGGNSTTRH